MYSQLLTPAAPFQVDLSSRPVEVDYTPARGLGVLFLIFGAAFGGFSVMALTEHGGFIKYLIAGGILLIGVMIFRLGLRVLFAKRVVRFEDGGVVVTERGLFGLRTSRESYDAFKGVAVRSFQISRKNAPTRYFQAVELQHEDAEAIALLVVEDKDEPREALEVYARVLGVPTIRDGEIRMPDDLDQSLVERIGADKYVGSDWTDPPKGLLVETRDNRLVVTLPPKHAKLLFFAPLLWLALWLGIGMWRADISWPVLLLGCAVTVPFWLMAWLDTQKRRLLEITRDEVIFTPGTLRGATEANRTLPLKSIEEVTVNTRRGLSIASDQGVIVTGAGLSKEMQNWLRHYIQAAIISA